MIVESMREATRKELIERIKELEQENREIREWKYVIDNPLDLIKIKGKEYISKDKIKAKIEEIKEEKRHYLEINDEYNAQKSKMNSIEILKNYCQIFRYTQKSIDKAEREEYGDIVGVKEVTAIENLLSLYEKVKQKNKKAIDFINDENNYFEDGENWQNVLKIKEILEE